jgi:Chitobiase/beta-hexosaminidase C-terminal domain
MSQTWVSSFHRAGSTGFVPIGPPLATPTFIPGSGTYSSSQLVSIFASGSIHYTTDGSTPTPASALYTGPITVSSNETLSAIAVSPGFANSAIGTATYLFSSLSFQGATLAGFTPGVAYSQNVAGFVSGGTPNYTFLFVASTGPDAWFVDSAGNITGTPGGVSIATDAGILEVTDTGVQITT